MDRVAHGGVRNPPVPLVAGQRRGVRSRTSRPNRLVEQTVSASNSNSSKASIVGTAFVGGTLGATGAGVMAALTQISILNCIGVGALVGAAGGALAERIYQSFHADGKKIVENYQKQVEELQDTPLWPKLEKHIPDDIASLHSSQRRRLIEGVNQVYMKYRSSPHYISGKQAEIEFLDKIGCAIERSQQAYKNSTFSSLDKKHIKRIQQYVRKHFAKNELGFFCQAEGLSDSLAKTNIYITRFPTDPAMKQIREKWDAVVDQYEKAPSHTRGSLLGFLAYKKIPCFHVNPGFPNHQYRDYAKPSLLSQRREVSEELIITTQLRRRAISKNADRVITPVEPDHGTSKQQSKTNHKIVHGPTFVRQIEQELPGVCINNLKKIEEDLRHGRVSAKSINGFYIYDVKMGDDVNRGRWRLLVERFDTDHGRTYQFNEISDYHRNPPVLWAGVKRV